MMRDGYLICFLKYYGNYFWHFCNNRVNFPSPSTSPLFCGLNDSGALASHLLILIQLQWSMIIIAIDIFISAWGGWQTDRNPSILLYLLAWVNISNHFINICNLLGNPLLLARWSKGGFDSFMDNSSSKIQLILRHYYPYCIDTTEGSYDNFQINTCTFFGKEKFLLWEYSFDSGSYLYGTLAMGTSRDIFCTLFYFNWVYAICLQYDSDRGGINAEDIYSPQRITYGQQVEARSSSDE